MTHARPKILFVDDEPQVLRGYRDILHKEAYELRAAGSAAQALAILAKEPIHVVVSDERMPSVSGSALLERVHRDYPDVVRIMLTGQASLLASVQAINDGLYRFLSKPIAPEELRRVLRDALHVQALRWSSVVLPRRAHISEGRPAMGMRK
jgi:DNA-binding NtrC family response regulator